MALKIKAKVKYVYCSYSTYETNYDTVPVKWPLAVKL